MTGADALTETQLGAVCHRCAPPVKRAQPPLAGVWPREMLEAGCEQQRWRGRVEQVEVFATEMREARVTVQRWFPFGLGPAFGDLMPSPDGGGDLLSALTDLFTDATSVLPRRRPVCPWGAFTVDGCERGTFGQLLHTACTGRPDVVPAESARRARWARRLVAAVPVVADRQVRPRRLAPGTPLGVGVIGNLRLLIGNSGPAAFAGKVSYGPLYGLCAELAPKTGDPRRRAVDLEGRLQAYLRSWSVRLRGRGYTPRLPFTLALQARHTTLHLPGEDIAATTLQRLSERLGRDEDLRDALLDAGWDELPYEQDELGHLLGECASHARLADTPLWKRRTQHARVGLLDGYRTVGDLTLTHLLAESEADDGAGVWDDGFLKAVLARLKADERRVAWARATAGSPITWTEAAAEAGYGPEVGERVRRKIKRVGADEKQRRVYTAHWTL